MYESHVTMDVENEQEFLKICNDNKLKPVIISKDTGSNLKTQYMTAKFHKCDYNEAYHQMMNIANLFKNVIRRKLEKIVNKNTIINFDFKYKEFHSKFEVDENGEDKFLTIIKTHLGHSSVNLMKGEKFKFFTTRDEQLHDQILIILKKDFKYLGTIREVVVYDDNESIDSNYNCKDCPLKKYVV